jgi:hypothetical protein
MLMNYKQKLFYNWTAFVFLGQKSAFTWRIEPVTSFMQGKESNFPI